MNQSNSRIQKWDVLKFILIYLVVLGHMCDMHINDSLVMKNISLVIYTFHMPLFLFISGMFSRRMIDEKQTDKMFRYLVLFYFVKLLFWIYQSLANQFYEFQILSENGVPWFMFVLFVFALLTSKLKDVSPLYVLIAWVIFACVAGYDSTIGDFLMLSRIIVFYPFYFLGYYMYPEYLVEAGRGVVKKLMAWVILIAIIVLLVIFSEEVYMIRPLFGGRTSYHLLGDIGKYGFWFRLGHYALAFVMGMCIIIIVPKHTRLGVIARMGQRTLPVYCFHYIVLYLLYQQLDIATWIEENIPLFYDWYAIPLALVIVWFTTLKPFRMVVRLVSGQQVREGTSQGRNRSGKE